MTTASIRKPNMIEFNQAWAFSTLCDRRRRNLHWGIKQLEDAFARCHRRLQNVVLLAEVLNGPEEALRVLNECGENANSGHIVDHVTPAEPNHAREALLPAHSGLQR